MFSHIKYSLSKEKIRFIIAGSCNTFLDFIFLNILTAVFGIYFVIANLFSVSICITLSYFLNHYFVFRIKEPLGFRKFTTFFAVTGFSSLALQSGIITSMHWLLGTPFSRSLFIVGGVSNHPTIELNFVKAIAVLVGMIWNFIFYKHVVFKDKPSKTEAEFIG
ncbi:MAG: GtrA family protein [bacterium]